MAAFPAGSEQTFVVPREYRCYEHITGIEFIEIDPNVPCPLSSAYKRTSDGAEMLIRVETPDLEKKNLTLEEARAFIDKLCSADVFEWNRIYCPAQGTYRVVTTNWRLAITFDEKVARHTKTFTVEGEDEFPDTYDEVVSILVGERIKTYEIDE